jgi:thiamine biosynthesis lipoprotein
LAEVLAAASEIRRRTGGLVDAGVGGRVAAWGYDRTFAEVEGPAEAPAPSPDVVWEIEGRLVTRAPGTRLDLGGIAKGWTADRAVERGMASVVSAGGDLRSDDPATVVDVFDGGGGRLAAVALGRGGLATSSISRRHWTAAGREVSHLIDPRTGDPVSGPVVSATVTAATAAEAEAGAKAVLLMGEEGLAWADRCSWVSGALVEWHDGSVFATTDLEAA